MSLQTWKCLKCEEDFTEGKWTCVDGQSNHVVVPKEYLMADAPSTVDTDQLDLLGIQLKPPEEE